MRSFKNFGSLIIVLVSFIFAGCEHGGDDDNQDEAVTNVTTNADSGDHDGSSTSQDSQTNENDNGDVNSNPPNPPPATSKQVIISNSSSGAVAISVNSYSAVLSSGGSVTRNYSGSSFSWGYDTGAGYDVTTTVSDGMNHLYNIYDSPTVPGTVEARGNVF